jgi:glycine/D-amino acid oxidase-like deaminating enzyme
MELTSDYPFWSIQNGLLRTYPALDRNLTCDAVVVGGGISGAMAAYYLAAADVQTILLDRRDIGTGSTSGSTALLQYEVDVPLRELIPRIGRKKACRSYQLCYQAVHQLAALVKKLNIKCDFSQRPSLFLARQPREIADFKIEHALRRQLGFSVELWDQSQIARHFPFSRPAALFSENAAQADPHRLTHGLLHSAAQLGLRVFDRTQVVDYVSTCRGIKLTTDRGLQITARRAVIAAGFESVTLLRGSAGSLKSTYALISEPVAHLSDWYRRSLIWESGLPYLYLRTTPDNRVIVGGEDANVVDPSRRDALLPRKTRILTRKFNQMFPHLAIQVAYSWAGTFAETKDGLAYIGENKSLPHAYFALGYGGNGITYSLIAARLIRDAFLGRKNPFATLFKFDR